MASHNDRLRKRIAMLFHRHRWVEGSRQKLDSRTARVERHCRCGEHYVGVEFDPPIVLMPGESMTVGVPMERRDDDA